MRCVSSSQSVRAPTAKTQFSALVAIRRNIWPLVRGPPPLAKSSLYEFHQTKTRFRVRSLPGFLQRGPPDSNSAGPLTPKPPSFSLQETRVCGLFGMLKHTAGRRWRRNGARLGLFLSTKMDLSLG